MYGHQSWAQAKENNVNKVKSLWVFAVLFLAISLMLSACGGAGSSGQQGSGATSQKAQKALAELKNKVLSTGPHGEKPTPGSEVRLSDDEIKQIQAKHATAAIVMHYGGNDWARAQIDGLTDQFQKMGIDVIATTDANFQPEKQVSDIETVLAKKPDIIVSIPTDPAATAN